VEHKSGNISVTRKDREKLLWRAYRNALIRMVPPMLPFLYIGGHPKLQLLLSQERVNLQTSTLADTSTVYMRTKAH